jgi:predicted aspartyl protease
LLLAVSLLATARADGPVMVPFVWTPGQIEVAVEVGGTPATFLLDTGSEYSIVSTRLAQALRLTTERRGARDFADDVTLSMKGVTLAHQRVMVMPFDTYYARGRTIDGLLGYDLFDRYAVRIDFTGKTLTLWPASDFTPPQAAVEVPITFAGRLPVVAATVRVSAGRTLDARLMVDTGASQAVILRHPFATAHHLFDLGGAHSTAPSLASGTRALIEIPVEQVSLGTWTFDRPQVRAFAEPIGSGGATDTDGLIGNALLSRFTLYVDYTRRRVLLEPPRR